MIPQFRDRDDRNEFEQLIKEQAENTKRREKQLAEL